MPSGTFVLFVIDRFPEPDGRRERYKTEDRQPRGSVDQRADPVYTAIRLANPEEPEGFSRGSATHRKGIKIEGFWHGNRIEQVVQQKKFDVYYDRTRRVFIAHVEKKVALSAVKDLNEDPALSALFRLKPIEIDFRQIIPRAINVIGSWFKGMRHTNIRTEAAFGDHIAGDPEFARISALGQHSNLIVVMDFNGDQLKVNISRVGSVFFLEDYPLETCLDFMVHLLQYRVVAPAPPAPQGTP